ncbi:MFS transporter, partial [Nocardia gipuzkoensis]|uniref:MFS transporter n=1 Tax=Nocardia gipuzkoensis TaxID=2749991 RepID=UPI0024570C97
VIWSISHDPRQRTVAIAVGCALAGGGAAAGPLLGGWLLEHYWWGSVFLVNLPVMLVLIGLGPVLLPESRDPKPGRFDLPSAVLSMLALVPVVYAVKEFAAHGPDMRPVLVGALGVLSGVWFVRRQRRLAQPMLDLKLFALPKFRTAVLTNLLSVFALAGVLFFGSQYLQLVLGRSPMQAGLLLLPGLLAGMIASLAAAWLVRRLRPGAVLGGALTTAAVGAALFGRLGPDAATSTTPFVLGFLFVGAGVGVALTVSSDLVVSSAPAERAGAAAAVSETAYETGIALGVAILGSVVMAIFRNGLDLSQVPGEGADVASESLGAATAFAGELPEAAGNAFLASVHDSFVSGIHCAAIGTTSILSVAAVVAFRLRAAHA